MLRRLTSTKVTSKHHRLFKPQELQHLLHGFDTFWENIVRDTGSHTQNPRVSSDWTVNLEYYWKYQRRTTSPGDALVMLFICIMDVRA